MTTRRELRSAKAIKIELMNQLQGAVFCICNRFSNYPVPPERIFAEVCRSINALQVVRFKLYGKLL